MEETNIFRFLFKFIAAEFTALLGFLFGSLDGMLKTIIAFVVIDYISGVIAAAVGKRLNSAVGFRGIAKKIAIFCVIAIANIIDVNVIGGEKSPLRTVTISFYIANEGLSILENVGKFVQYPKPLRNFLEQLRDKNNKEDK